MSFNSLVWLLIGIFLFLFGLFSVTNIQVEWGRPVMGFSALIAGVCCIIQCVVGLRTGPPPPPN